MNGRRPLVPSLSLFPSTNPVGIRSSLARLSARIAVGMQRGGLCSAGVIKHSPKLMIKLRGRVDAGLRMMKKPLIVFFSFFFLELQCA
jgi:hypothetical protein